MCSGGWAGQVVLCAAMKFGCLCSWAHLSCCTSQCGKAVATSGLLQCMRRSYLHCLLLLGFCNPNNLSTAMENIKGSILSYWPSWSINILPPRLCSWDHVSEVCEELQNHRITQITAEQHTHLLVTYFGWFFFFPLLVYTDELSNEQLKR